MALALSAACASAPKQVAPPQEVAASAFDTSDAGAAPLPTKIAGPPKPLPKKPDAPCGTPANIELKAESIPSVIIAGDEIHQARVNITNPGEKARIVEVVRVDRIVAGKATNSVKVIRAADEATAVQPDDLGPGKISIAPKVTAHIIIDLEPVSFGDEGAAVRVMADVDGSRACLDAPITIRRQPKSSPPMRPRPL
jgi:hypothetical protein